VDRKEINKIEVIPMRKGDPLFRGFIYITSGDYQIFGSDLMLTKDAQIQFVDTVNLLQETILINGVCTPVKMQISSYIKIFGFRAIDMSVAAMSNYQLNRPFDKKFFNNETFKIEKQANKKDSIYWVSSRNIVLSDEESKHYFKSDSTYAAEHTPAYLDSIHRVENKIDLSKIFFTGYSYSKHTETNTNYLSFSPLLFSTGFNTVEGLYFDVNLRKGSYNVDYNQPSFIALNLRYGLANKNFSPGITGYKTINSFNSLGYGYKLGRFVAQYNNANPINGIINAAYTLLDRQNFMKIYQIEVAQIYLDKELLNGLYARANSQYFQRQAMVNHSYYSFVKNDRIYTSNNPLYAANDLPAFATHQGASLRLLYL